MEDGICFPTLGVDSSCRRVWAARPAFSCLLSLPFILLCPPLGGCAVWTVSGLNARYVIFGFKARHFWKKSLNLSEPQFAHLPNGPNGSRNIDVNIFSMYLIASICPVLCCFLSN